MNLFDDLEEYEKLEIDLSPNDACFDDIVYEKDTTCVQITELEYIKEEKGLDFYTIYLIVEDSSTTKKYFNKIINTYPVNRLLIKPFYGVNAQNMQSKIDQLMADQFDKEEDKLYLLSDLDHYRSDLICLNNSKNEYTNLIISNPCIEIWFYYHYNTNKPPLKKYQNERHNSGYIKNDIWKNFRTGKKIDTTNIITHSQTAIANASANYELDPINDFIPGLYSTQMHFFIGTILDHINECLRRKQEQKKIMKERHLKESRIFED